MAGNQCRKLQKITIWRLYEGVEFYTIEYKRSLRWYYLDFFLVVALDQYASR